MQLFEFGANRWYTFSMDELVEKLGDNLWKIVRQKEGWKVCTLTNCFYGKSIQDALRECLASIKESKKNNS